MENFRLIRLKLLENEIFKLIDVRFYDNQDSQSKEPYTTLIIGPNGTGKSFLLRIILNLFAELNDFKISKKRVQRVSGRFCLEYEINGQIFKYSNYQFPDENEKFEYSKDLEIRPQIIKNGNLIDSETIEIPKAVLALSNTITDRFYTDIEQFNEYTYLGVKVNSNTARTSSFINRTIHLLYEMLPNKNVLPDIEKALDFLGYKKNLVISYYPRYKHIFFKGNLTDVVFDDFFMKFWEFTRRPKESNPWNVSVYKRLKSHSPELIPQLVILCNKISKFLKYEYKGSRTQYFDVDVFLDRFSAEELKLLRTLHSLDLISHPTIGFYKQDKYLALQNTSSGEYHFISSFIGLLAKVNQNSLVLIDEPENSLHPNWQMKYITFLKTIFEKYNSSHFIITSHSHFIVSDLLSNSSAIVALRKEDTIQAELIRSNTYAWSAEEILLKIFKVSSTRNFYLTEKLEQIFSLIGQEPTTELLSKVKIHIDELKEVDFSGLSDEDPLKDVVQTLFKKFENV